jgi:phage tail sheath protein FI
MPGTYTYPGVYVEEVPSGVRPIAGVSTSDTAFVDFFPRGPLNEPVRITSFEQFERRFDGFDAKSQASYAINQYFVNGGSVAWVVRAVAGNNSAASHTLKAGSNDILEVTGRDSGEWGRKLMVLVDHNTVPTGLFNLTIEERAKVGSAEVVALEVHRNLSMDSNHARYAVNVVNADSQLVEVERKSGQNSTTSPDVLTATALTGGAAGNVPGPTELAAGINALDKIAPAIFNLLCLPGLGDLNDANRLTVAAAATAYCARKRAFLLLDIPPDVDTAAEMTSFRNDAAKMPAVHENSAIFFPRLKVADPLQGGLLRDIPASGTVAGIFARTDARRGVWKAPAGTDATIAGAELVTQLDDQAQGPLNVLGVNVLRSFPIYGALVWGARTTKGADAAANEWKYVPVRRTALFIEESLYQGLKWVVFEPNDEPLWAQIRSNVDAFMNGLFRQGAFAGLSTRDAYFVKCDKDTTTSADVDRGIVNILVGFRPLKPAEFVVLKIQQMAGQAAT